MQSCCLAGYETVMQSFGAGPVSALLLHCSLGRAGAYRPLAELLGEHLTTRAFDQPGHGRASPWDGSGDLQDRVLDMALDALDAPAHLIGHSFGGTVALRVAQQRPDLALSLTLIEPVLVSVAYADLPAARAMVQADMNAFYTAFERGDMEGAAREFTSRYGDGRPWETIPEESRAAITSRIPLVVAGDSAVHEDRYGLASGQPLVAADIPTLILDSASGGPLMEAVFAGLARRIPQATRVQIKEKGAGHMLPLTHPIPVAEHLRKLILA